MLDGADGVDGVNLFPIIFYVILAIIVSILASIGFFDEHSEEGILHGVSPMQQAWLIDSTHLMRSLLPVDSIIGVNAP